MWSEMPAAGGPTTRTKQPLIVRCLGSTTDAWHVVVPVVNDVTDVLLLTSTADSASPFWWVCLIALVVADRATVVALDAVSDDGPAAIPMVLRSL